MTDAEPDVLRERWRAEGQLVIAVDQYRLVVDTADDDSRADDWATARALAAHIVELHNAALDRSDALTAALAELDAAEREDDERCELHTIDRVESARARVIEIARGMVGG